MSKQSGMMQIALAWPEKSILDLVHQKLPGWPWASDLAPVVLSFSRVEWGDWAKDEIRERHNLLLGTARCNINRLVNHMWGWGRGYWARCLLGP